MAYENRVMAVSRGESDNVLSALNQEADSTLLHPTQSVYILRIYVTLFQAIWNCNYIGARTMHYTYLV